MQPDMEWNGSFRHFVPPPQSSLSFLYNYNYDIFPGVETKHLSMLETPQEMVSRGTSDHKNINNYGNLGEKKKRLTSDQLDSLERSFQEDIKLDPDRKIKLSRELGLQPRQIAVWFQNRRARWKAKQLENLYDALKQEFDVISREKHKLQQEVVRLKGMLREQATNIRKKQGSTTAGGFTEVSGEETVESASVAMHGCCSNKPHGTTTTSHGPIAFADQGSNYLYNSHAEPEDYNNTISVSPPYWGVQLPTYPSC